MNTMQIDIINPEAEKLIKNLAALNLIAIRKSGDDGFLKLVNKLRAKAKGKPPSLEVITKEVELVIAERYAKSKR